MQRKHHYLKTLKLYYGDVKSGLKNFEVRFNDRDYKVGDVIHLQEYHNGVYTGNELVKEITYVLNDSDYCKEGYVVLGLRECKDTLDEELYSDIVRYGRFKTDLEIISIDGVYRILTAEYTDKKYFIVKINGRIKEIIEI